MGRLATENREGQTRQPKSEPMLGTRRQNAPVGVGAALGVVVGAAVGAADGAATGTAAQDVRATVRFRPDSQLASTPRWPDDGYDLHSTEIQSER